MNGADHAHTSGVALAPMVAGSEKGNTAARKSKSQCVDLGNSAKTKPAISGN